MIRIPSLFLAACVACLALPAAARPLVQIDVIDRERGQQLPVYRHRGDAWIAGTPGHRYGVRLTNASGERVLVVLSVDGVNAVSGETADPAQAGYVLGPWQSTEIAGWRKSLRDVARFVFTDLPDSYAARTGRPDHVGVIGIAVFREAPAYVAPPAPPPAVAGGADHAAQAARAPAAAAQESAADGYRSEHDRRQAQRLGTGHGTREWAPVSRTAFERASHRPAQVTELRYDAPERLVALGILPRPHWRQPHAPRAFPTGFVPDPR
jgi:hypothetical protein